MRTETMLRSFKEIIMTSPGYISIAAVAVLQFPRAIEPEKGRRHVVMDATFFVVEGSRTATVGLLRYFASDEMANEIYKIPEKEFQRAFVVANVCEAFSGICKMLTL